MVDLLGQDQGLLTPPPGLRWISQAPQRVRRHGEAPHPRRNTLAERLGPLRRPVDEGEALLQVPVGRSAL